VFGALTTQLVEEEVRSGKSISLEAEVPDPPLTKDVISNQSLPLDVAVNKSKIYIA
jgi:hypothetical protein